ncbi:MAG: Ig-like domain-containing protein, partial [Candidatus Sulfotelmatobacter sp.]
TTPIDWTNPATTPFSSAMAVTNVLGQQVYDTATVSGTPAAFTPTGNVNYYLSTNGGAYSLFDTEPVGTQSLNTASLAAGSYSFEAQYLGDGNYQQSPMSAPEPLTINQGSSSVSTAISDSGGGVVSSVLGEKVYDTATVTGTPAAFAPTGNVKYYFSTDGGTTYSLFDTEPVGTQSINTASLPAGSYSFEAQYSGDSNYAASPMSSPEPLTINKATPTGRVERWRGGVGFGIFWVGVSPSVSH